MRRVVIENLLQTTPANVTYRYEPTTLFGALSAVMLSTWAGASSAVAQVRTTRAKSTTTTKPTTTTTKPPTTTTLPAARWPQIARVSDVAVGQSVSFTFGSTSKYASGKKSCPVAWSCGGTGILYRATPTSWLAYESTCTHAGVLVGAPRTGSTAICSAHGSQFSLLTGHVVRGPAGQSLPAVKVSVNANGYVYWVGD